MDGQETKMKAYEVTIPGWDGHKSIIAATDYGPAKAYEYRQAREAGFNIDYTRFRAKRSPDHDKAIKDPAMIVWAYSLGWDTGRECNGCLSPTGTYHHYAKHS